MRVRLTFILLVISACSASAQQPKVTIAAPPLNPEDKAKIAEVIAFEEEMEAAVVRGDVQFLDRALSNDFLFTHGDGWTSGGAPLKVDSKQTWLAYVSQQPRPYVYRRLDSVQVELHGDIAITYGRYRYQPRPDSPNSSGAHLYVWFERVYVKRNGRWQHLSHRTVRCPVREDADPQPIK